jgi:hypothetical protein
VDKGENTRCGKLRDLSEFWGKHSAGYAGQIVDGKKSLSQGEAQVMLQRLLSAGTTVDFDEVRRLRKLTDECGDDQCVV